MAKWLAVLVMSMMGMAFPAMASPCVTPTGGFDYGGYGPTVEVAIEEIATLPAGTVMLAGRYHDGANTVHPALLISQDAGETWSSVALPFAGAGVGAVTTHGAETAWAVVSDRQEGLEIPRYLLRSRDRGSSWCAVSLDGMATLNAIDSIRFFDDRHGLMVFTEAPFGEARTVYHTADGGNTWQGLWQTDFAAAANVENDFTYPQSEPPPHAPIWQLDADLYRIVGLLRFRPDGDFQVIERYEYLGNPAWVELTRIERYRPTNALAADGR